jgi:(1->4)-alpha-D-glucan 1-alpha-D-glucosylmutase
MAVKRAIGRNPKMEESVFRFVRDAVLQKYPGALEFAGRFQQLTAPVTAKGVEDTAFYCYHRLISLNEVGGEPGHFGVSPDDLHEYFRRRQADWPHSMSALSTHDTKRSEDVRARINVLSELPGEWRERVMRWREINSGGRESPAADEEYLLYQTLVGAWPIDSAEGASPQFAERIQTYMVKAMREAKVRTSWVSPNEEHEAAVKGFVGRILGSREFLDDFVPFQRRASRLGMLNSLSQTLLRLTAPGVPDTYQGTEVWDLSLVDPDNRRPVDYERRWKMLEGLRSGGAGSARRVVGRMETGEVKMYLTWRALQARRAWPALFSDGEYVPGEAAGARAGHVFGFARRHEGRVAVVIVPRLMTKVTRDGGLPVGREVWGETAVRFGGVGRVRLRNVLTDETLVLSEEQSGLAAAEALASFPVALLISE